jgi:hypothetical protein
MGLRQNKKKIMHLLEQFDWMFGCQNFDRSVVFKKEDEYIDDRRRVCVINYHEDYQEMTVLIFPCFFEKNLQEQRKILLHEFVHTITIPLNRIACNLHDGVLCTPEQIRHEHERATSKIDNILNRLLIGGMTYAKKAYKDYLKA